MELGSRAVFAAVLLAGVAGTGIVVRLLNEGGYFTLGVAAWILGYGTMVVVLWYGWVRPLDLSGPTTDRDRADSGDTTPNHDSPEGN